MSDISNRLNVLERVAKANEPKDDYKHIYPLSPLEFTKLQYQQGEDAEILKKIWHKVVDDYEQDHLDELQEHLQANPDCLPPWRALVPLADRPRNGDKSKPKPKDRTFYKELEKRALDLYEQYKKGQLKL